MKKQERQNHKRKLSKEKTQRNKRRRVHFDSSSESEDTAAVNSVIAVSSSGPSDKDGVQNSPDRRQRQLPARFREDSDSDENDGILCTICQSNELDGLPAKIVFWLNCDQCRVWAHK